MESLQELMIVCLGGTKAMVGKGRSLGRGDLLRDGGVMNGGSRFKSGVCDFDDGCGDAIGSASSATFDVCVDDLDAPSHEHVKSGQICSTNGNGGMDWQESV